MIDTQPADLGARYAAVRRHSQALAAPLSPEDQCIQSMPDASPAKWHLAHTTWFFETVVLLAHAPGYAPHDERFARLFNSYYEALGPRHPRPQRGMLTRPSLAEVLDYRAAVDAAMRTFVAEADLATWSVAAPLIELGLHHEQQHQELLLTDILHALSLNPLLPAAYPMDAFERMPLPPGADGWVEHAGGEVLVGHGADSFAFDNETPRHRALLHPHALRRGLVTNAEYQDFIDDGGYRSAALWLSDGWALVQAAQWDAPLYWLDRGRAFSLHGEQTLDPSAPVRHLSFYEAAAYAEWAGARLPTEFEWEAAASAPGMAQLHGAAWQWTRSSYDPYPGYRPWAGTVAEYNGKFMSGQIVLRGSSSATPPGHARDSYRNFFAPSARWQFSGLRLAKNL